MQHVDFMLKALSVGKGKRSAMGSVRRPSSRNGLAICDCILQNNISSSKWFWSDSSEGALVNMLNAALDAFTPQRSSCEPGHRSRCTKRVGTISGAIALAAFKTL